MSLFNEVHSDLIHDILVIGDVWRSKFAEYDAQFGRGWRDVFPRLTVPQYASAGRVDESDYSCELGLRRAVRDGYLQQLRSPATRASILASLPRELVQAVQTAPEGLIRVEQMRDLMRALEVESQVYPAIPGVLNANVDLLQCLGRAISNKDIELSVRLDPLRTMKTGVMPQRMERGRWFGAPFRWQGLQNLHGPLETVHAPLPSQSGHRTQFLWEPKGDRVQFAVEELPDPDDPSHGMVDSGGDLVITTRFAHGIFDVRHGAFEHLDGHVLIYSLDDYDARLGASLTQHTKRYEKFKIFRLDSAGRSEQTLIPGEVGGDIVISFFRWNEMVREYFSEPEASGGAPPSTAEPGF